MTADFHAVLDNGAVDIAIAQHYMVIQSVSN